MTKTEIKSAINKAVYQFAESIGYSISDDNDGSFITFYKPELSGKDSIDYHRSSHQTYVLNHSSDEIKADAVRIELYALSQIQKYMDGIRY